MGIRREDAIIACKGGFSARVKRGENKILEMERHLESLKEKLNTLETMLPLDSSNNFHNQANEPKIDDQEGCPKVNEEKLNKDQMCVLQTLAVKEKKLRDEIFNMECKEKEYLQTLSQANVRKNADDEEMQKADEDNRNFTRVDNSPRNRKGESVEIEKISRLEEYSKKLCNCLRSIQNNRKIWSRKAGDLSKEINCLENSGSKESSADSVPEGYKKSDDNKCPCGEPVKCDSCIICNCADWEQDLKIDVEEKRKESNELKQEKKRNCKCFHSSSNSDASSQSLEINNIYKNSEMSIETPSIPSTVDGVITGNEEDKKIYSCHCKPEDDCQKFCEICLCDWEREYNTNQQLYSETDENCHWCDVCNEERFRGGTDFGISINNHCYENFTENLTNILKSSIHEENKKIREKIPSDLEKKRFLTHPSSISKCLKIEEIKENKIIAALVKELNQTPISIRNEIWKQLEKKRQSSFAILTKDLVIGLLILLLTCLSCFLGFSGISSFLLLLKVFLQIFIFPIQTCSQIHRSFPFLYNTVQNLQICAIYRKFSIFYDNCQNFLFNHCKMLINVLQIFTNKQQFFDNLILIFVLFFSFFFSFFIFLFTSWENKFQDSDNERFSNSRTIVTSFAKRIMILVLRPIIILLILIKFVLLLFVTVSISLISSCVPQMIRNVTYRLMNSSFNLLLLLFKKISTLSCIVYVICIIFGFSLNKVTNFNEFTLHLENLTQSLKNYLHNSSEIKTKNISDNWIQQLMKPSNFLYLFNIIIENVIKLAKMIFHTFEIR